MHVDEEGNIFNSNYKFTDEGQQECNLTNMCTSYLSECRFVFKVNKIWFMSKNYRVQLKLMKAQVKPVNKKEFEVNFIE